MKLDFNTWRNDLVSLISSTLHEFRCVVDDEVEVFAVDCHPWNGVLFLAMLTRSELEAAPFLSDAAEMAAWMYYDFGANLASWKAARKVASKMRTAYESSGYRRSIVADQFLKDCAAAVASRQVQDVLSTYRLSTRFTITVPHPDSKIEYYQPT